MTYLQREHIGRIKMTYLQRYHIGRIKMTYLQREYIVRIKITYLQRENIVKIKMTYLQWEFILKKITYLQRNSCFPGDLTKMMILRSLINLNIVLVKHIRQLQPCSDIKLTRGYYLR